MEERAESQAPAPYFSSIFPTVSRSIPVTGPRRLALTRVTSSSSFLKYCATPLSRICFSSSVVTSEEGEGEVGWGERVGSGTLILSVTSLLSLLDTTGAPGWEEGEGDTTKLRMYSKGINRYSKGQATVENKLEISEPTNLPSF